MESLAITLVIVFAGIVILPNIARRIGLPVIVTEILYGMIIGKSLFDVVPDHPMIEFFSSFGLVYLMFLAGLETDFAKMTWRILKRVIAIVVVSISIPFVSGYFLAIWLDTNPLLMGTILCTTSLGLILPLLKDLPFGKRLANMLLASVVLVDIISLFILAFVLATLQGSIEVRFIYSFIGILILFFIPWLINKRKLRRKITTKLFKKSIFDLEMRVAFAVIFILAAISSQLGFHAIVGAFIAGLLISEILPKATLQEERLQSFGYSFFIPLFFIFTGARVNIPAMFPGINEVAVLFAILAVGILSKAVSVFVVTKLSGQNLRRSAAFGLFHSARLSLIIAAADISIRLGFIKEDLFGMLVILAVVSATVSPALGKYILRNEMKK